jgi:hypothetical protein
MQGSFSDTVLLEAQQLEAQDKSFDMMSFSSLVKSLDIRILGESSSESDNSEKVVTAKFSIAPPQ